MTLRKKDTKPTSTSSPATPAVPSSTVNGPEAAVDHDHELSSNTLIAGGTFVTMGRGGVFQNHTHTINETRKGMRKLSKMIVQGAFHNSAERHDPPKCHPKTREKVLQEIMDWVQEQGDLERGCFFKWLYGPAGAGKSAIAQTIAELCYKSDLLAASFFFSRSAAGRNDHSRLIATLSYQLCLSTPEIRTYVEDAVELDPNIFSLSSETQLQKLIIEPFSHFSQDYGRIRPRIIIIDGLDECTPAIHVQRSVLQILAKNLPVPMLFLVASRPEPHIRGFFMAEPMASMTTTLTLDDSYLPDADIKVFLQAKFDTIKPDHPSKGRLPESWPSAVDVDRLVCKSSGQFIYASTVMKFVESPHHWPTDRLEIVFGTMSPGEDTPFAELDALYTHIFSSVKAINKVLEVISVLLLVQTSIILMNAAFIEALLSLRMGDLNITLIDLHSILEIPQSDEREIRVLHTFLGDFLLDQTRSGSFRIDQAHAHANLARHFMRYIPQKATGDHEISTLQKFSSVMFTVHCAQAYPTEELLDALWDFNIGAFWQLYFEGIFIRAWIHAISSEASQASLLSDFFTWLKNNGSSRKGRDLYSHYLHKWDRYIQHSLTQLSLGPVGHQYLVFFILPQFREDFHPRYLFSVNSSATKLEHQSLLNVSSTLDVHDGDSRYDLLLVEFFSDPSRSGPFYLDGDKYASFAITFTKYLISIWYSAPDLSCLSILLSKASYSQELATLLNSELLSVIQARRPDLAQNVADIVQTYCQSASTVPHRRTEKSNGRIFRWLRSKFRGS